MNELKKLKQLSKMYGTHTSLLTYTHRAGADV